jgi:hypothetical protein
MPRTARFVTPAAARPGVFIDPHHSGHELH